MRVVFVRREARPISTGSVDLDHHQFIGGKRGSDHVDDLAGGVAAAAEIGGDVFRFERRGSSFAFVGTRHSAISQIDSALNDAAW